MTCKLHHIYDANLSFFMDEFIIYVIIQNTKSVSVFFCFNYENMYDFTIHDPILQSTISFTSHDPT